MAHTHHLEMLKQDQQTWNAWKEQHSPDFVADFQEAFLTESAYDAYDFRHADFRGAFFWRCSFIGANLRGADLSHAVFFQCSLTQADLSDATLTRTTFATCSVQGTRFTGANRNDASFF